jgi:outer membrane biosynthesis protein TonB
MPDENTTTTADATQPAPAPAENVKPDTAPPAPAPAEQPKSDTAQPAPAPAETTQRSPAVTRAPTRVARGVTRKGAPNTAAAAKSAKPAKTPAAPAKSKVPDYRKLKLNAEDVIGGVRKVNPWKEGTKGHGYYAKYRGSMTVAEAVKAGVPRGYIAWDIAHGFITIKSEA